MRTKFQVPQFCVVHAVDVECDIVFQHYAVGIVVGKINGSADGVVKSCSAGCCVYRGDHAGVFREVAD